MSRAGASHTPEILIVQHAAIEGPGHLAPPLDRAGVRTRIVRTFQGERPPRDTAGAAGLILLGGPMGVYETDRFPHLGDEILLASDALRRGVPLLGICLGAQILAAAAGGRVVRGPALEIGWHTVTLTPQGRRDPLLGSLPAEGEMFHWHGDTFEPPPGGTRLASSRLYAEQAFHLPPAAWGVQYHPEITPDMVDAWAGAAGEGERSAAGGPAGLVRMREQARRLAPLLAAPVAALTRAFLSVSGLGAS